MLPKRLARPVLLATTIVATAAAVAMASNVYAASRQAETDLPTIPALDLTRYAGVWHEIARMPSWFQRRCAGPAQATYTLRDDGRLQVHNRCQTDNGEALDADGIGEPASAGHPGQLRVSFAPAWLRALGIGWGDYWILALADDYTWSLVGTRDRRYLWILARDPALDQATTQQLVERARSLGYPVDGLQFAGAAAAPESQTPR